MTIAIAIRDLSAGHEAFGPQFEHFLDRNGDDTAELWVEAGDVLLSCADAIRITACSGEVGEKFLAFTQRTVKTIKAQVVQKNGRERRVSEIEIRHRCAPDLDQL